MICSVASFETSSRPIVAAGLASTRRKVPGPRQRTSAHDPVNGYLPVGWTVEEWIERRQRDPRGTAEAAKRSMAQQVRAILELKRKGVVALDYGNNIRAMAKEVGVNDASAYPGFVEAYVRPLFCFGGWERLVQSAGRVGR